MHTETLIVKLFVLSATFLMLQPNIGVACTLWYQFIFALYYAFFNLFCLCLCIPIAVITQCRIHLGHLVQLSPKTTILLPEMTPLFQNTGLLSPTCWHVLFRLAAPQ